MVEITGIKIKIQDLEISLTPEEAKLLKQKLDELFSEHKPYYVYTYPIYLTTTTGATGNNLVPSCDGKVYYK